MPINTRKTGYDKWAARWEYIRDAIDGSDEIKAKTTKYLPQLNGQTPESYEGYLKRASYVNFSARTLSASLGQIFRKNPRVIDVDKSIIDNIDLAGSSFLYFFKDIAKEIITVNRTGVLLDYSDKQKRPYLTAYQAESIINWQTSIIDGIEKLSLVVLEGKKSIVDKNDKYRQTLVDCWKELYLDENNIYHVQNWIKNAQGVTVMDGEEITPVINDNLFSFIPFYIITSSGITDKTSKSIMLDFVNLNLGHYVNSADYENMLHWTGAKTIVTKGWGNKPFPVGGAPDFPTDGGAEFLESSSDSGLEKEMRHKEEQMAALGSQIISGKGRYVASAETSRISSEGEQATLADISKSLSDCATRIMTDLNAWAGTGKDAEVVFNSDFETAAIDPQYLTVLMGAVQSGYMSPESFFYQLQKYEMYAEGWSIEDEQDAIAEGLKKQIEKRDMMMPESLRPENTKAESENWKQDVPDMAV